MKTRKNLWQLGVYFMFTTLMLCSCGKKKDNPNQFEYLAVQMSKGDSWSIIDKDGKEIVKEEYSPEAEISLICDGVYWVKEDGKLTLFSVDQPKKPLINESFSQATHFAAGHALVSNPNQQIRIINTVGKTVATLPKSIKTCDTFSSDGYAIYKDSEGKNGLIDTQGNIAIKASYAWMGSYADGIVLAQSQSDDKELLILDAQGKKLGTIDLDKYDSFSFFSEGKVSVRSKGDDSHPIVLDKTGKKLFDIKKANSFALYQDGYAVVSKDGKYGLADDKGELVIRLKYDNMSNFGNGIFAAKKGEKWGVVNAKDETLIDFDFDVIGGMLGKNYIVKDGGELAIIGQDGKEIISFDNVSTAGTSYRVEYVDVDGLTDALMKSIEEYEQPKTAAQMAKELSLSVNDFRYQRYITQTQNIDNKVSGNLTTSFDEWVVEEKTHQEKVSDGWFSYNRTVSDGYHWTQVLPTGTSGTLTLASDIGIGGENVYAELCKKLQQGRTKISDGMFSKNVKVGGKNIESRTAISVNGNDINLEITFHK